MSDRTPPGVRDSAGGPGNRRVLIGAAIVVGIAVLVGGCTAIVAATSGNRGDEVSADDPYRQTWVKAYSDTTCADWASEMTDQQQFAASADILTSAWQRIEGSSDFPPDALIREFREGVSTVCVEPTMTLTDASGLLYLTEPRFAP